MKTIKIKNEEEVLMLANRIIMGEEFSNNFKFRRNDYFDILLSKLNISKDLFYENDYYCKDNIYIAGSILGYFLISSMGFVVFKESCDKYEDKMYTALSSQYELMQIIIEKISDYNESEMKYNINSSVNDILVNLCITYFHNYLFYLELLCKYYIYKNNYSCPNTHSLRSLLQKVKVVMFEKKQNDSLFHYLIVSEVQSAVNLISKIPGNFKEQYVKYNDNDGDNVCIKVDEIKSTYNFVVTSFEIMLRLNCNMNSKYMEQGFYSKKLKLAKNDTERKKLKTELRFLIKQ